MATLRQQPHHRQKLSDARTCAPGPEGRSHVTIWLQPAWHRLTSTVTTHPYQALHAPAIRLLAISISGKTHAQHQLSRGRPVGPCARGWDFAEGLLLK